MFQTALRGLPRLIASTGILVLLQFAIADATAAAKQAAWPEARDLVVGQQGTCMLDPDGTTRCLGLSDRLPLLSSSRFVAMTIGQYDVTCGLKTDGDALCWGFSSPDADVSTTPGPWRSLSAGGDFACGIRTDGRLQCWGDPSPLALRSPSAETYLQVAAGDGGVCALRHDATVACWNGPKGYTADLVAPQGNFHVISVGSGYACGVTTDGRLVCWGDNYGGRATPPAGSGFVSVSTDESHACALQDTGLATCWGSPFGGGTPPWPGSTTPWPGSYTDVGVGATYSCGRRPNGTMRCWGQSSVYSPFSPQATARFRSPVARVAMGGGEICAIDGLGTPLCMMGQTAVQPVLGRFRTMSLIAGGGCGITRSDRIACWGTVPAGVPSDAVRAISMTTGHGCAIREDGRARCWGDNGAGQATAPSGEFIEIAVAANYSCGLTREGALQCWGAGTGIPTTLQGSGYRNLTANDRRVCIRAADGRAQCWGSDVASIPAYYFNTPADAFESSEEMVCLLVKPTNLSCFRFDGQASGRPEPWFNSAFDNLAVSGTRVCVSDTIGMIHCNINRFEAPLRVSGVGRIALGANHACNLRADGSVFCNGDAAFGQTQPPAVHAKAIDANANHACLLGTDHRLRCWGDDAQGGSQPPAVALRDFDIGQFNGCGVSTDGTGVCWGWNINGQGNVPAGRYQRIATGLNHTCAIRESGTLACWGYGVDGQTNAPIGQFVAVDVGERHSCAIAANGRLRCWGLNSEGQSTSPGVATDTFRALAVGPFHACAIRHDNTLACWGRNNAGQSSPPQTGRYRDVSVGALASCAIREDGVRTCWGNAEAQLPSLAFSATALPGALPGVAYAASLQVVGSSGYRAEAPVYKLVAGALPGGLQLTETGVLQGVASLQGRYGFTIEAVDDNGLAARQAFRLDVGKPRLTGGPQRPALTPLPIQRPVPAGRPVPGAVKPKKPNRR